jgi:FkbM family methyltransferase
MNNVSHIFNLLPKTIECRGIIQVGANTGQELPIFKTITKNIIVFEPIKSVYDTLISSHGDVQAYNVALGSKKEKKKMYAASNNYESSSFMLPKNHLKYYPQINFNTIDDIDIVRFDSLDIDMEKYNILFSDTQGYELEVLLGFGDKLNSIDAIYVEYIDSELYESNASSIDIITYLNKFKFEPLKMLHESNGWGNLIFVKKEYV